jgi:low affinity Fe/Cu permease
MVIRKLVKKTYFSFSKSNKVVIQTVVTIKTVHIVILYLAIYQK